MFHRMLRGYFAGRYAEYCADIARLPALHSCKGMVSNQMIGFPIPESRDDFRSAERIKNAALMCK
jgi:hypothetical protein